MAAWTTGDAIDGGAGNDTFNIVANGNITVPTAATVKNVETVNATSGGSITLNTTSWTGLTALNTTTSGAAQTLTAAATTDVTAAAGAQAATAVSVNGGNNVTVNATGVTTGTTTVGATTAAAGVVTVTSAGATLADGAGATTQTQGAIAVTGGSKVNVSSTGAVSGGSDNAGDALTLSAVNVTGDASTTEVTVTQTAAQARVADVGAVLGKAAIVNGAVTIADKNAASATAAGTIATATLNNYGNSTIDSGALTTVNLSGTAGTLGVTAGALTTAVVDTLALNVNELSGTNAITLDADYKTLNLGSTGKASTIANVTATGVTALNVSGDAKLTLTDNTFAALQSVTVTNTAGVTLGTTALGAAVAFTGGAGADSIILSNAFEKAITMGAGNDTVTVGGTTIGAGGSVAAGDGTDTVVMTSAQAATFDNDATFNTKFTGFEVLRLSDALAAGTTLNIAGLNNVTKVILAAGGANAATSIIDNIASGSTVQFDADSTGVVIQETNALFNPADTLNLVFNKTGGVLAAGSITAAGVETINIIANDASTATGGSAAVIHTATLVAGDATKVTVSGNNGLNLTNANAKITTFDASGVVANGTAGLDTAANLGVTFASANNTTTANVTITGGAGNDTLTGNAAKDTINGGAGADIITGGLGLDTIQLGSGRDVVKVASNSDAEVATSDSTTATADVVTGFSLLSAVTASTDLSSVANFQAATAGGANANMLVLDLTADDAVATTNGTNLAVAIEGNGTGTGQAAGVTYTVTNGILALSGAGAATVDTLGEWLTEAAAVSATAGETVGFVFGGDTYVFAQNGAQDVLVQLVGVQASALAAAGTGTFAAGTLLIGDSL